MLERLLESMDSNFRYSLFQLYSSLPQVEPWVIVLIVVATAAFIAISVILVIRAHRLPVSTGREDLLEKIAEAKMVLNQKGTVLIEGEIWPATSEEGEVQLGEEVVITKVDRLKLSIIKK